MAGRMLVVDDEKNIRTTMEMIHRNAGWETASADGGDEALERLAEGEFDIVYLDVGMPKKDGIEVLKDIMSRHPDQLVVILTGNATIEKAVEATRIGAFDFLEKDCGKEKILLTSRNALDYRELTQENRSLRRKVAGHRELLGESAGVRAIHEQIDKVAPTNARVLILGESGTGKELIAQAIHDNSQRAGGPFIKVNCAAIPEELIEAELFGSVKGAFTGAEDREGKFQSADGGTLFLDEIGDMSLRVQTKVLRALQEGEVQKVGSNTTTHVDVRVIAATNKHLAEEVAAGRFREDLYFRLNVVPIESPPLRARGNDIALLARAFLEEYCRDNGVPEKTLSDAVVDTFKKYPWPGNVRELRNQVERVAIMAAGDTIEPSDLSAEIRLGKPDVAGGGLGGANVAGGTTLQDARKQFERDLILGVLTKHNWNVSRAAEELGLERTNLHKKIKGLGLKRSAS